MKLTQKELKKLLHYSKKSGLFTWKAHRGGKATKDNTSGITGVTKRGQSWSSQIYANERYIYLGTFKTKEEAKKARRKAEKELSD